ncbi:MAG: HypC/HybG/HupF family hydrogenase formation chaperone [Dermatophilaceae bacterium]
MSGGAGTARVGERALTISLLTLDEPVAAGDWVVVHSGFALQRLDHHEAADALWLRSQPAGPALTTPPDHPRTPTQEQP